jgi:CBS domain containing-hemolysin-like protein
MDTNIFNWIGLGLCLLLSFLLSGMEAGVFALNRLRVRRLARAGKPSAKLLHGFLENPEKFLWTILVGNTLANFLILGFSLAKIHEWFLGNHILIVVVFVVAVFLFYTFFDLLPKILFRAHPNSLCLSAANVFRFVNFALSPLVLIVADVSKKILKWTGGQAFTGRLFGNREEMRAVMQ